jgi:hypothetical protein
VSNQQENNKSESDCFYFLQINLTAEEKVHITDTILSIRSVKSYFSRMQEKFSNLKRYNEYLGKSNGVFVRGQKLKCDDFNMNKQNSGVLLALRGLVLRRVE